MTAERRGPLTPEDVAVALRRAGRDLTDAATEVRATGLGAAAFGAAGPGVLGELGGLLHGRWSSALRVREAEARDQADRMADLADALRKATEMYVDTDLTGSVRITDADPGEAPRRGAP